MQCRNNMNKFWILFKFTDLYISLQHFSQVAIRWNTPAAPATGLLAMTSAPTRPELSASLAPRSDPIDLQGIMIYSSTQGWTHLNSTIFYSLRHFVTSFLRSGCVFLMIVWNCQHIKEEQAMWHCGIFSGRITLTWCIEPFKLEWLQHPTRLSTWIIDVWPSQ